MTTRARLAERLEGLRRRFSRAPNVVQTADGTSLTELKTLRPHRILGRGLCLFRSEDFSSVPKNRRAGALRLQVPVWSPFARTGHHSVWAGGRAMVWLWDEDAVAQAAADGTQEGAGDGGAEAADRGAGGGGEAEGGIELSDQARVLPESVFLPRKPDGAHVQACCHGYEVQFWQSDALVDAFWYAERPSEMELRRLLYSRGDQGATAVDAEDDVAADVVEWPYQLAEPWTAERTPREWLEANERALVAGAALLFVLLGAWQEVRVWKFHAAEQEAAASRAEMQEALGPLLEGRRELLDLRRLDTALAAILAEPSQALLMSLVDQALPTDSARIFRWNYEQQTLDLTIDDPALDSVAYVEGLEAVPLFDQVLAESARDDRIRISLRVRTPPGRGAR